MRRTTLRWTAAFDSAMDYKQISILQIAPLTADGNKQLEGMFRRVTYDDLEVYYRQVRGLVTAGGVAVDAELIGQLPSLEVIATRGVGFNHIDLEAARARGIVVSNTPGVLTDCVADLAIGALIATSRRLLVADRFVRAGQWLEDRFPLTDKVSGKRLGIVGMGRIGRAIARRARGFDMEVRYHSRTCRTECPEVYEPVLEALADWADFLVICAPGGDSTRGLVSAAVLDALGPNGFLVNVARGSLVDERALVEALGQGRIAGAALDVFAREPRVPQELLTMDQVVLLPHIASSTVETFAAMENLLLENLQSYFTAGTLLTSVEGL